MFIAECRYRSRCRHAVLLAHPFSDKLYSFTTTLATVIVLVFSGILIFTYSYLRKKKASLFWDMEQLSGGWKTWTAFLAFRAGRIQSCFYQRLEFTCATSPPERSIFISPKHKPNLHNNSARENGFALSCGCVSSVKEYSTLASALVLCLLLACFCWSLQKHS